MPPTIPDTSPVDSLDSGTERNDTLVTVHFVGAGLDSASTLDSTRSDGWSSYERARVQAALDAISAVANIQFQVTSDPDADFQLVISDDPFSGPGSLGYFYLPNFTGNSVGVFNPDGFGWTTNGLREGGLGYATIVHELLHGLGLDHPHDGPEVLQGVTSAFGDFGDFELNQGIYTTMSYNGGFEDIPSFSNSFGNEAGPMALDIAALQDLYGANMSHATGDDVYRLDDSNSDGAAWQAIWDAGGEDTIIYSGGRDVVIDLRAATLEYAEGGGGWISSAQGVVGGFTIANGVVIENAIGGSGDDVLLGNGADNTLIGNAGSDDIVGGDGNDTVSGNSGADQIEDNSGTNVLNGGSGGDTIGGGTGSDTIRGGSGNDDLSGNGGADAIFGGRGVDVLRGGSGNDDLIGGMGADTLTGGAGADDFIFQFASDSWAGSTNRDEVTDFEVGVDDIDLSGIAALGGLTFVGTSGFSGSAQVRLQEGGGNTVVQVDIDGDRTADIEIFLNGATGLTQNDFIL